MCQDSNGKDHSTVGCGELTRDCEETSAEAGPIFPRNIRFSCHSPNCFSLPQEWWTFFLSYKCFIFFSPWNSFSSTISCHLQCVCFHCAPTSILFPPPHLCICQHKEKAYLAFLLLPNMYTCLMEKAVQGARDKDSTWQHHLVVFRNAFSLPADQCCWWGLCGDVWGSQNQMFSPNAFTWDLKQSPMLSLLPEETVYCFFQGP